MALLIAGVLLWSAVHFIPTLGRSLKAALIAAMGESVYRATFSAVVVASLVLIVLGWRSTPEVYLYQLPAWVGGTAFALMIIAFVLFGAAKHETIIKRWIRHPQLASIVVWSTAHLLTNGTTRALVLFGGLAIWALIETPLISAREGSYERPAAPGVGVELKGLAISAVIFIAAMILHPYFAGVSPVPR